MQSNLNSKLPFHDEDFNFDKFEALMNTLLSSGSRLRLSQNKKYDIADFACVTRYGKQGDSQKGIDILAQTAGGKKIGFQCKYHESSTRRVGLPVARKCVADVKEKFGSTDECVLVTNTSFTPDAIDHFTENGWIMMGSDEIHALVRDLPSEQGYDIINDHFGQIAADRFYPLGPHLLISPQRYKSFQRGALSHEYECIGREAELKRVIKLLTTKKKSCVILTAEGGIGKSRFMCEVLERIQTKNPESYVKILQASNSGSAKQINLADQNSHHLVAIDDAHINTNVRQDVIEALSEVNGHLLLITRPEGVNQLRNLLSCTGWDTACEVHIEELPRMKKTDLISLAQKVIGENNIYAKEVISLVDYSCGNALFTVIGASLIKQGHRFSEVIQTEEFHRKVFQALVDNFTSDLNGLDISEKKKVLRTLKVLALLSPFNEKDLESLSDFLDLNSFDLSEHIELLFQAGLLKRSNDSLRIIPDLFADYLVCELMNGKISNPIIKELQNSELLKTIGPQVFQNLAFAEYLLRKKGNTSLLKPLWTDYKESFKSKKWYEKGGELRRWIGFSVYLYEEAIELVQMTFECNDASDPYYGLDNSFHSAFEILVEICRNFDGEKLYSALDILWSNLLKNYSSSSNYDTHPLRSIFSIRSRVKHSALQWLEDRLTEAKFAEDWISKRSVYAELCISGLLKKTVDATYSSGRTIYMGTDHVHFENTKELRTRALAIVRKVALYSTEGALNSIPVLSEGADRVRGMHSIIENDKLQKEWLPFRIECIDLLFEISAASSEPVVQFEVRKTVKNLHWQGEPVAEFEEKRKLTYSKLPTSLELDLTTSLLSYRHHFDLNEREEKWEKFHTDLVSGLIDKFGKEGVLDRVESTCSALIDYGYHPNLGQLLEGISEVDPSLLEDMRLSALEDKEVFKNYYLSLAYYYREGEARDQMLLEGFKKIGTLLLPNLFNIVVEDSDMVTTKKAVTSFIKSAEGDELELVINLIPELWSDSLKDFVYENFNYEGLNEKHISMISKSLDVHGSSHRDYPKGFLLNVLSKMLTLPDLNKERVIDLLVELARIEPIAIYNLIISDVVEACKKNDWESLSKALPYKLQGMRFKNEGEISEETIKKTYELYLSSENKSIYRPWLKIIMSSNLKLSMNLYRNRVAKIISLEEFEEFLTHEAWISENYLLQPEITKLILEKAEKISKSCLNKITQELVYKSTNVGRGFTNGELDDHTILQRSLKFREQYRDSSLLFKFYDALVKNEQEVIAKARMDYENEQIALNEF